MTREEARFGIENFSTFTKADGLGSDESRIPGKDSLHEVETGAVVPVKKFYAEKET